MKTGKMIRLLCCGADEEAIKPIEEQLVLRGFRVKESAAGKNDVVLAALSEDFYRDENLKKKLLDLIGAGADKVLPVQLDAAPVPDELKNALYARNIIPAAGREPGQIAERIVSALPKKNTRLPLVLTAGALALIALVGLLLWRANQDKKAVSVMAQAAAMNVAMPEGLTEEDLERVRVVVVVGDRLDMYTEDDTRTVIGVTNGNAVETVMWPQADEFAYRSWQENGPHYYDKEDGHEYAMTHYDDLRFLRFLPNLRSLYLSLVSVDAEGLPDLRGSVCLEEVTLGDCEIPDLTWLAGPSLHGIDVLNTTGSITDLSPLTECDNLSYVHIDLENTARADFSGFAPPKLDTLWISNGSALRTMDLSALAGCADLRVCMLDNQLPLRDISFLANAGKLQELRLRYLSELRDVSALSELKELRYLEVYLCPRVTDYSPVAGCVGLEEIFLQCDTNPDAVRDGSFMRDLPRLRDIGLYSCNLRDMDFLEGVADNAESIRFGFAGNVGDYSGLAYVKHFGYLHVNPSNKFGDRGGDFSAVLPYIQDAQVDDLMLYDCAGVDLSRLPENIHILSIRYGDLTSLEGLKPYRLDMLELYDCRYLTSLDGIESLPALSGGPEQMELSVYGCPRLTDWSALDWTDLGELKLTGTYTVPDLSRLHVRTLHLESVEELTELSCLDGLDAGRDYVLELIGLDGISDLSPLHRLHGPHLTVPPQVADQAGELVEAGNFEDFDVEYPDGSWQPFDSSVMLLGLEELETLPKSLLRRVERLGVAGDTLFDFGQEKPEEYGPGTITDMGVLADLTGLRELELIDQPLRDLNGVQALESLEYLCVINAPELTDVSAAFALPDLQRLHLIAVPVTDIRGAQNLTSLREICLSWTDVTDLTPLLELEGLETVRVSRDMTEAIASLEGREYHFNLEIEDN